MRKMIDSGVEWLGAIPQDWDLVQIKSIASCKSEKSSYIGGAYIGLEHIESGSGKLLADGSQTGIEVDSTVSSFSDTDILFGKLRPYLAKAAKPNFDGQCSTEILVLNPSSRIQKDFLFWYLLNPAFIDAVNASTYGAKMPRANWNFIGSCYLPLPPMNMQTVISSVLNEKFAQVDTLIANVQAQIEKLKAYKQSVITEVVTKGLDPTVPMKDSGVEWIGMIPNKWRISRIGLHYSIVLGKMLCPRQTDSTYTLEEYFCAANVHFGEICTDELKEMWFSPTEKRQYHIETGDMLIVEGGAGAGGCAIVQSSTSALAQNSIMIVRNLRGTDNRYLCYFIESLVKRGYIDVICNKATIPHFTKEKLSKTQFPVCSQEDQILISDYLDKKCSKIDRLISLKQAKIEKLEQYKKSLIYEYVTGKKEI